MRLWWVKWRKGWVERVGGQVPPRPAEGGGRPRQPQGVPKPSQEGSKRNIPAKLNQQRTEMISIDKSQVGELRIWLFVYLYSKILRIFFIFYVLYIRVIDIPLKLYWFLFFSFYFINGGENQNDHFLFYLIVVSLVNIGHLKTIRNELFP